MTTFDAARVRHVAALARLTLSPEEEAQFGTELAAIADAFEAVEAHGESEAEGQSASPLREDAAVPADDAVRTRIVAAFPREEKGFARVPRGI